MVRLAVIGAELFLHLNSGRAGPSGFATWRSHLISRAAELQRFVASANAAAPDQHCPSLIVGPGGDVIVELTPGEPAMARAELDLQMVSDHYLEQRRTDLV